MKIMKKVVIEKGSEGASAAEKARSQLIEGASEQEGRVQAWAQTFAVLGSFVA